MSTCLFIIKRKLHDAWVDNVLVLGPDYLYFCMFSEKKVKKTKKEITFLFEIEVKQHKFSLFQALFMDFYKNPNMETKTLNSKYLGYIYICMYIVYFI